MKVLSSTLFVLIPFFLFAQMQLNFKAGILPTITTSKVLFPIGAEFKTSKKIGLYSEFGVPVKKRSDRNISYKNAYKIVGQLRYYNGEELGKNRFMLIEFGYRPEQYSKFFGEFLQNNGTRIIFDRADVSSTISGAMLKFGWQRIFPNRLLFEWEVGIGYNHKKVVYSNIIKPPPTSPTNPWTNPFGINLDFLGDLDDKYSHGGSPSDGSGIFGKIPDTMEGQKGYLSISIALRFGIVLFDQK